MATITVLLSIDIKVDDVTLDEVLIDLEKKMESAIQHGLLDLAGEVEQYSCSVMPDVPRQVIEIEGGIIQRIVSDLPLEALILDADVEGCDPDEIVTVDGKEYMARREAPSVSETGVNELFEAYDNSQWDE